MRCEVCGTECNGKTCSGACRAKLSRRTHEAHAHGAHAHGAHAHGAHAPSARTEVTQGGRPVEDLNQVKGVCEPVDPETRAIWSKHRAQRRPDVYPDKGVRQTSTALPGQPGYKGVCVQGEDGVWRV